MTAMALVLIIEGLLPFLVPQQWQRMLADLSRVNPRTIRIGGIVAMLSGAIWLNFLT